jgi:hypothetical protein
LSAFRPQRTDEVGEAVLELVGRRGRGERVSELVERGVRVGVEVVERGDPRACVGGGLLMDMRQLPHDEAEHVREQGVEGPDRVGRREAGGTQDRSDLLELVEDGTDGESAVGQDPREGR